MNTKLFGIIVLWSSVNLTQGPHGHGLRTLLLLRNTYCRAIKASHAHGGSQLCHACNTNTQLQMLTVTPSRLVPAERQIK